MKTLFKFEGSSGLRIHEVDPEKMTISGTMLVVGVSTNNRLYEVSELENIAKNMVGKPIVLGIKTVVDRSKSFETSVSIFVASFASISDSFGG